MSDAFLHVVRRRLFLFSLFLDMSLSRQIFSNTVIQLVAKLFIAFLSVVTIKMITSHLGTQSYGEYTYIYEYLAMFAILADMGIYTIAVREMTV